VFCCCLCCGAGGGRHGSILRYRSFEMTCRILAICGVLILACALPANLGSQQLPPYPCPTMKDDCGWNYSGCEEGCPPDPPVEDNCILPGDDELWDTNDLL